MNKQQILKDSKSFGSINRKPMPRPTVFKDRTKYDRKREKQYLHKMHKFLEKE